MNAAICPWRDSGGASGGVEVIEVAGCGQGVHQLLSVPGAAGAVGSYRGGIPSKGSLQSIVPVVSAPQLKSRRKWVSRFTCGGMHMVQRGGRRRHTNLLVTSARARGETGERGSAFAA